MKRKNNISKFIFSKFSFIFLLFFLIVLIGATSKITAKRYKINKEIYNLKKEANDLDVQNKELTKMIEYLDTLSFKEKEARLKLGLQKEGEKTIIITSPYSELKSKELKIEEKELVRSNILKWWEYFFSKNKNI
ncbi:MAG: Uncharacterized protein Athens101410_23 [Parcubacteria group bacterium Athens1014_10]|nr:MAG: Uncharacterized protein Athens101410_23 [Parcubacteria group bacterium Athens1014_10]TSD06049.1 MAG: Uncharacterized protein Athens071412_23 [Parcubacteria group bacterium Athens0714_12]